MPDPHDLKRAGIEATNLEFSAYEQVDKPQCYHLAEVPTDSFDENYNLPLCSLESPTDEFAAQLGGSLADIGFAIVTDTGIDPSLYRDADARVRAVFSEPDQVKQKYAARRHGAVNQGYFPFEGTSEIHPDLVEGWVFCRRAFNFAGDPAFDPTQFWPAASYELGFRHLVAAHVALCLPLMQAMLRYLGTPPHTFDHLLTDPSLGLRLNYYPPVRPEQFASGAGRLLGHEDVNLFTILPAPTIEGLQVFNRATGRWIRLSAPPGSIIVNTGDYMQRLTGDRLPSTTHRVAPPRDPDVRRQVRTSYPLNIYLPEEVMLEQLPGLGPPRYPPIRALDFHTQITAKFYGDDYAVTS